MRTIAIIGAGYSGVSLAVNLQRLAIKPLQILLFETRNNFGLGAAYATQNPAHLLNVLAGDMSAFPDRPNDFVTWLEQDEQAQKLLDPHEEIAKQYVPRLLYGRYLQHLLAKAKSAFSAKAVIDCKTIAVTDLEFLSREVLLTTADGKQYKVDQVVLAYGNLPPQNLLPALKNPHYLVNPWNYAEVEKIPTDATVLILGTGLTMVDVVLTLTQQGHEAPIYALSRRGLLPQTHKFFSKPYLLTLQQLPKRFSSRLRYIRREIADFMKQGGDWQAAINAISKLAQQLWQELTLVEKRRFLRHLQPYWDTHRHRIAPKIATQIENARAKGQLQILAGKLLAAQAQQNHFEITFRPRHESASQQLQVDYIISCTGPQNNFVASDNPLLHTLEQRGIIQLDQLRLGLVVTQQCAIVNRDGIASQRFFSLGTPCKGMFWECISVPFIRAQSYDLAKLLISH